EGALAVVDLEARQLVTQIETVFDPKALTMTADGSTLFVASHRSGQTVRYPFEERDPTTELDIAIVDTESMLVSGYILDVAATIKDIFYHSGKDELWVSAMSNDTAGRLNDPDTYSFQHEVFSISPAAGIASRIVSADLSRQASSTGRAVATQGLALCGETLYVVAESSDITLALDPETFAELSRIETTGRPRDLLCTDTGVLAHSAVTMQIHHIENQKVDSLSTGVEDPRPAGFAEGYMEFSAPGLGVGDNRSCSTCHVDALGDRVVWNAGPFPNHQLTRPFRWLEGTGRIGWDGYVGSVKITAYVGGSTTNTRPTTDQALNLGTFLASLMPAPAANGKTLRDGSLSLAGHAGKSIFEGKGGCAGCHSGAKTTNQVVYEEGMTAGLSDVPTLVDVPKVGSWLKDGSASTLEETVDAGIEMMNLSLTDDERASLVHYLHEITDRDFFVLNANFEYQELMAVNQPIVLTFNQPVLADGINLARIMIEKPDGSLLSVNAEVNNRHVTLRPRPALEPATTYKVIVGSRFQADDGRMPSEPMELSFTTANLPTIVLEGDYEWVVGVPAIDFAAGAFNTDVILDSTVPVRIEATEGGGVAVFDLGDDLLFTTDVVIDGDTLHITDLPVPAGPSFGNGSAISAGLFDADSDGIADGASGTLSLSGPAFDVPGVRWRLQRPPSADAGAGSGGGCDDLLDGPYTINVERAGASPVISWDGPNALGVYVTAPEASLPAGPGQTVSGGDAYWVLEMKSFPAGFAGPVTYGQATADSNDASPTHGAPEGGAELIEGTCYKFSVVTNTFETSSYTMKW
ncbi:MAG: Ig-like domain-containing protein, partial [Myxococcota bacterium]|nr:Ig-like domain-containing protein [Myxococcota bacterium]